MTDIAARKVRATFESTMLRGVSVLADYEPEESHLKYAGFFFRQMMTLLARRIPENEVRCIVNTTSGC